MRIIMEVPERGNPDTIKISPLPDSLMDTLAIKTPEADAVARHFPRWIFPSVIPRAYTRKTA
jgi:hypothetical protein